MLKKYLLGAAVCLLLAAPAFGAEKSVAELMTIARAGAGLVLDLETRTYTVTELASIAANLKYQATLTIKINRRRPLSATECARIAKERPGQVLFWF